MADPIDKKVEQIIERLQESRNIVEYFQQIAKMTNLSAEDAKALNKP
jgi:methyl-accepting chemotaxis protein